jgi:Zn-finger nucleic acid-binding protein
MVVQASVTIACQKCGGTAEVVAGQQYHNCVYCDSLIQLAEISEDRILPTGVTLDCSCATCDQPLQTGLIENRRALFCGSCFGILIRHADFAGIIQERQARRAGQEPAEPRPIDPEAYKRQINCPSCSQRMETHPYYGPGNIVVDTCSECGYLWLDHGEISRVENASFIRRSAPYTWNSPAETVSERMQSVALPAVVDHTEDSPLRVIADLLLS